MSTCIWSGDLPRALEAGEGPWGSGAIFLLDAGVRSEAQETGGPHSRAKPKQNPATGAKMSNKNVMLHVFSPNIAVAHVFGNKTRPSGPSRLLFFATESRGGACGLERRQDPHWVVVRHLGLFSKEAQWFCCFQSHPNPISFLFCFFNTMHRNSMSRILFGRVSG